MANPFSQYVPGNYVSQYVGLPKEQFAKALASEQKAYDIGVQGMNKLDIAVEHLPIPEEEEWLRQSIRDGISREFEGIKESGRAQDAYYLIPKVAKDYILANPDVIKSMESKANMEIAEKMRIQFGPNALVFNDPRTHKTVLRDLETGETKYDIFRPDTQQELNYDSKMQNIYGNMPVSGGYKFKQIQEGIARGLKGKEDARGISIYTIKEYLPKAMARYRGTIEYKQQVRKLIEIEKVAKTTEEADAIIKEKMLKVGLKQVRSVTTFEPLSTSDLGGGGPYDPSDNNISPEPGETQTNEESINDLKKKRQQALENGNVVQSKLIDKDINNRLDNVFEGNKKLEEIYKRKPGDPLIETGDPDVDKEINTAIGIMKRKEVSGINLGRIVNKIGADLFKTNYLVGSSELGGDDNLIKNNSRGLINVLGSESQRNLEYYPIHRPRFNNSDPKRYAKNFKNRATYQVNRLGEYYGLTKPQMNTILKNLQDDFEWYNKEGFKVQPQIDEAFENSKIYRNEYALIDATGIGHMNTILETTNGSNFSDIRVVSDDMSDNKKGKEQEDFKEDPAGWYNDKDFKFTNVQIEGDNGLPNIEVKDTKTGTQYELSLAKGINIQHPILQTLMKESGNPAFNRALEEAYMYGDVMKFKGGYSLGKSTTAKGETEVSIYKDEKELTYRDVYENIEEKDKKLYIADLLEKVEPENVNNIMNDKALFNALLNRMVVLPSTISGQLLIEDLMSTDN